MEPSTRFQFTCVPVAESAAVVLAPQARFTVLTSRLIRIEHSPSGRFEDRASQAFWHRRQPLPAFEVQRTGRRLEIVTEHLRLRYDPKPGGVAGGPQPAGLAPEALSITLTSSGVTWRYGDAPTGNLLGTARTVDQADGAVPLGQGLVSRAGWALVDDSAALVFNAAGWLEPRPPEPGAQDLYFFGYGHDYAGCLRDFQRIAGPAPLIPRWALGNWWSRYWAYSQDELQRLVEDFRRHEVPLAVCIVDMDWHITQTGNACSGWTGYTWNRDLFPDPEGLIAWLHECGLRTALNLHPAEGVHPHECAYEALARAVGVDAESREPVPFDIADPRFTNAYFDLLHHPMEAQGVDFWWIDWQQGTLSRLPGLDPLWWLNHLHFQDLGRDGRKRPFIFSRWGGLGNHRYPIGFSGDSIVSWRSLAFQPYLTATAANVAYGWWSHDIGGHMSGIEDPELYLRWLQCGALSPILRLHSTKNPYHERRPWGHGEGIFRHAREAMQVRHALIPYLYTMAWRSHREGIPLIRPLYHTHAEHEEAYRCPNEYWFGSELIAAPHVRPADPDTRLSRSVVWLPEAVIARRWPQPPTKQSPEADLEPVIARRWPQPPTKQSAGPECDWFDFFTGERYPAGWHARYGGLDDIPLYARAGAIVPLGPRVAWGGVESPEALEVHVFPGADNRCELYEDDGCSQGYLEGHSALTPIEQRWHGEALELRIGPVQGEVGQAPARRRYDLVFKGVARPSEVALRVNGQARACEPMYDETSEALRIAGVELGREEALNVTLVAPQGSLMAGRDRRPETLRRLLRAFRLESYTKMAIDGRLPELLEHPERLAAYGTTLAEAHVRAITEVALGAGADLVDVTGGTPYAILWNNHGDARLRYRYATRRRGRHFGLQEGVLPHFAAIDLDPSLQQRLQVDYLGLATVVYEA
ncbi:MAG TPA: glycoside hydrolase family 31 protein [Anaerolineae bacterium]|mgnify:CR=1 FL=1|nr:glycoside hydrolase family 31 protein [Anaerolineae bacterium]HOQ99720.1 glycoside hydrolase family 31 protein [Anaerolineae bacterium]HPL26639.1 glycoside hydrolase family 31 protein [Anaerolineae bacterium]